jgi:hypothetical protein
MVRTEPADVGRGGAGEDAPGREEDEAESMGEGMQSEMLRRPLLGWGRVDRRTGDMPGSQRPIVFSPEFRLLLTSGNGLRHCPSGRDGRKTRLC